MGTTATVVAAGPVEATFTVVAGPDAGRSIDVPAGRWLLGRAPGCAIRLVDPAVEAHHVLVSVAAGAVSLVQLTGRTPIVVDGSAAGAPPGGAALRTSVEVGDSLLVVGRHPAMYRRIVIGWEDRVGGGTVELAAARHRVEVIGEQGVARWRDVVDSFVGSVVHQAAACGRTVAVEGGTSTVVVVGGDPDAELAGLAPPDPCRSRLQVGARWRARWWRDVGRPLDVERVHLRGLAAAPGAHPAEHPARSLAIAVSLHDGRSSLSR